MIICYGKKLVGKAGPIPNLWQVILRKCPLVLWAVAIIFLGVMGERTALADTPVTLYESFAGNINITGTAGTLRTAADGTNSCSVTNSGSMQLLGLPAGSTIVKAYLYWAGSGGDPAGGAAADYNVTFNGTNITADRTYTASYLTGYDLYFFGGVKDVTSTVALNGNATYTFSNLTVQTADVAGGGTYCSSAAVLSAFALVVVYSNPSETLHVVNLWEGLQTYRGGAITLTPSNFIVPTPAPVTALSSRHIVLTWEGDYGNSDPLNGYSENLTFCAPVPCTGTALIDTYNPANNQFNSTVDVPPNGPFSGVNTTWGVDLDMYDITTLVHAGNASAQAIYSSGGDLVILANQTMSVANVPVADLAIAKSHTGSFTEGTNGVYTIGVTNNGPSSTTGTITMTDTLPTGLTYVSAAGTGWTCGAAGQIVTCTRPSPLNSGVAAPAITLTVSVGGAAYPSVTNSATVSSGAFDNIAGNNTASDPTTVIGPNLSTSTKTVVDLNGGSYMAGDVLQYTITLTESNGIAASGVSVTDAIDANLTSFTVVSYPAGATNRSTGTALNITGISVPASGSVTIVYTAIISGSATPGTTITNTATVTNPNGTGATPAAPVVTVAGDVPGTGTKQLYLYDNTSTPAWKLSRTPNTTTTGQATITTTTSQTWIMNPAAAANITINAAVPVILYLSRNGTTGTRNVQVNLQCSPGGTTFTQTRSLTLTTTPTAYTFTLPNAASETCGPGHTWNLNVSETSGSTTYINPAYGGNSSHVNLPATTVINVNSIGFYNAAYSGGSVITSVAPGTTVYIRAVVSDPFGSYDIVNAPAITIKDPSNNTLVNAAAMTLVAIGTESPSLTKIYEYQYNVPSSPTGNWSVSVKATEGTEGTVTNTAYTTMPVMIPPVLTVVKSSSPSPSVNPGQVVTYTVIVTNTGAGTATSVVATDFVPTYTTYVANSTRLNSITVAGDGSTLPLIAGLLVDDNVSRGAGVAATGVLLAGRSATITFQVTVN
jgi:trimeric autotransporter adhesin